MSGQLSWYDILDILPGSSADEVQRAFALKAGVLRPEMISGAPSKVVAAAGRALTAVETARSVLLDPVARRRYDVEIGIRKTGGGLAGTERVPSESGPDPSNWIGTRPLDHDALLAVLATFADWLVPRPAVPRRVAVPDIRGLLVGPCRRFHSRYWRAARYRPAHRRSDAHRRAGCEPNSGPGHDSTSNQHAESAGVAFAECSLTTSPRRDRLRCQLGKADFQPEVTEPEIQETAACPMHYPGQQDDGKDDQNKPCKEHDDARD
jgi:curved DNA-binding protein CbpA